MKPIKADWSVTRDEKTPVKIINFITENNRIYAICCSQDGKLHRVWLSDLIITDEEILG